MRIVLRIFTIVVIVVIAGELIVRVSITLPVETITDPELGWMYRPHSTILHTSEGWARNRMNVLGFNDEDPVVNSEKSTVLVLGDSITEALQVPRAENFTSLVEIMDPCLDVFNAGRSGLSPVHYPTVLSRVTKTIAPGLVVVVVSFGDMSDIVSSNYEVVRDDSNGDIVDIRVKEKQLNRLRVKLDPVLSRSALATYLLQRGKALLVDKRFEEAGGEKAETAVTRSDIDKISELLVYLFGSMNKKYPVAILYIPKMLYGINRRAVTDSRSDDFEKIVRDAASGTGLPMLSAEPYMKENYLENGQPGVGFPNKNILVGHLNRRGHQATTLALHDLVMRTGLRCHDQFPVAKQPIQP